MGRQMAICSGEKDYVRRFTEFANGRDALFAVHGFTDCGELSCYTKEHPAEILLLSEELTDTFEKKPEYGKIILLSGETYQAGAPAEYPVIYKYQSCARILSQAMDLYAETVPAVFGTVLRTEAMKKIGIYSPIGRTGKTSFALALGKEIAKKKRTLYLNLEEYSGFGELYPMEAGMGLSELMYFLKRGKTAFACKLEGMIRHFGELDYIEPLRSPVEFASIERADWEELFRLLEKESRYEVLILDLSGMVQGLYELLEGCSFVYTPTESDETARAKIRQYEDSLRLLGREQILERTQKLELSAYDGLELLVKAEGKKWTET